MAAYLVWPFLFITAILIIRLLVGLVFVVKGNIAGVADVDIALLLMQGADMDVVMHAVQFVHQRVCLHCPALLIAQAVPVQSDGQPLLIGHPVHVNHRRCLDFRYAKRVIIIILVHVLIELQTTVAQQVNAYLAPTLKPILIGDHPFIFIKPAQYQLALPTMPHLLV